LDPVLVQTCIAVGEAEDRPPLKQSIEVCA
jgi:hypothetical protein